MQLTSSNENQFIECNKHLDLNYKIEYPKYESKNII